MQVTAPCKTGHKKPTTIGVETASEKGVTSTFSDLTTTSQWRQDGKRGPLLMTLSMHD